MVRLKCGCHERDRRYSEKHDAFYCNKCNIWLEDQCGGKTCEFCAKRPKRPERKKK